MTQERLHKVLARAGIDVDLHEMRPERGTAAHTTDRLGELVCSNSFRNATMETAVGLLSTRAHSNVV